VVEVAQGKALEVAGLDLDAYALAIGCTTDDHAAELARASADVQCSPRRDPGNELFDGGVEDWKRTGHSP